VYAAGYSRTRAAAAQYDIQSEGRRPKTPSPVRVAPHVAQVSPAPIVAAQHTQTDSSDAARNATTTRAARVQHASTSPSAPTKSKATAHADSTSSKPIADTAAARVTPPTVPTPDSTKTASVQVTDSATQATDKDKAAFKDGTYSAWGTSRHGDIEATVLIKGGRIEAAIISQCLTQYSCSLISELPIQVVLRQSPEVDFVSGATQSTNAFYYAVLNALKKAK
jgi:uncharacterized protein with FMN-binding domain